MEILKNAIAGTLESSDVQIMIEPADDLKIELNSSVEKQYGDQILDTVKEVLSDMDVKGASLVIQDQGALDCTIRARVETVVLRSQAE